jgi:hypothetical protein
MTQDPENDLAYIRQVMEQTRQFTLVSGDYFIVWGVLISLGLICSSLVIVTSIGLPIIGLWITLIALGWVLSLWLGYRKARYEPVTSYAVRLISSLWVVCGIAMTTAFLLGPWAGAVPYISIGGLSALFIGIGIFMTGILNGMNWFRNLAIGWWIGALVMFVWHGFATLWISAGLLIVLMVIPGIILNQQARSIRKSAQ